MSETIGITSFAPGEGETEYKLHRRFDRLGRLYGDEAVKRLMSSKVVIFGVGGVGSFTAEALARSAIGHITQVDFDEVCVTNTNRQMQAMRGNIGKPKTDVLKTRLQDINPQAKIASVQAFYKAEDSAELLRSPWGGEYDFVVDAIDNITAKCHLLATCKERGIPVISSMGAAGKTDPTAIRIADIGATESCRLAKDVRSILRKKYGFPQKGAFGIPSVFSKEARKWPRQLSYDKGEGFRCVCPHRSPEHGCDSRALIDGTSVFVTGAFGLAAASVVVNRLTEDLTDSEPAAVSQHGTIAKDQK